MSFGPELDWYLDQIVDRLAGLSERLEGVAGGDVAQLVNSSGVSLDPGTVLGIASTASLTRAIGGTSPVTGVLINTDLVAKGDLFVPGFSGLHQVKLESGINPTAGSLAWLSSSSAGTVTSAVPSQGRQLIGIFQDTRDPSGRAPVVLILDPIVRNVP